MAIPTPESGIKGNALRLSVTLNNSPLKNNTAVASVGISHAINKISFAEIILIGDANPEAQAKPYIDDDSFIPGTPIKITAGYDDNAEAKIFEGVIVKYGLEITDKGYEVRLLSKHELVRTTFGRKEQEYENETDDAIINAILSTYSLTATVDSTSISNELFMQKLATDWDLILSRAEFNGLFITMDGSDGIVIGKAKFSSEPVLEIASGTSIISFTGELNAERQPTGVTASGWDPANLILQSSTAAEPSVNSQGSVTPVTLSTKLKQTSLSMNSSTLMSVEELQAWADNHLLRLRMKGLKGRVTFLGSSLVHTGDLIKLSGVGNKFNGNAYVSSVNHDLKDGEWKTTVLFGLDDKFVSERPDFSYSPALGQVPSIQGLQFATVKQLSSDPQSLNRVMITLPSNATSQSGIWARCSNFYATNSAGSVFLPEVGDEVVVAFVENDPRYPVILGSMYSSKNVAPNAATDENNYVKSITTKSKMSISFDDENKVFTIKTPAGNSITLSEDAKSIEIKDQNSNSVKLDNNSGIVLNSSKDIEIKATGNIKLSATQKLSLESTQDLKISSTAGNTEISGLKLSAKGTATAEFSATGQTVLKGGIVMIN